MKKLYLLLAILFAMATTVLLIMFISDAYKLYNMEIKVFTDVQDNMNMLYNVVMTFILTIVLAKVTLILYIQYKDENEYLSG